LRKMKFVSVFMLLALLLGAGVITVVGQGGGPVRQSEAFAVREETVRAALARGDLFDCAAYLPDTSPILPVEKQIFHSLKP